MDLYMPSAAQPTVADLEEVDEVKIVTTVFRCYLAELIYGQFRIKESRVLARQV
jgi:hypothetical protein